MPLNSFKIDFYWGLRKEFIKQKSDEIEELKNNG